MADLWARGKEIPAFPVWPEPSRRPNIYRRFRAAIVPVCPGLGVRPGRSRCPVLACRI